MPDILLPAVVEMRIELAPNSAFEDLAASLSALKSLYDGCTLALHEEEPERPREFELAESPTLFDRMAYSRVAAKFVERHDSMLRVQALEAGSVKAQLEGGKAALTLWQRVVHLIWPDTVLAQQQRLRVERDAVALYGELVAAGVDKRRAAIHVRLIEPRWRGLTALGCWWDLIPGAGAPGCHRAGLRPSHARNRIDGSTVGDGANG